MKKFMKNFKLYAPSANVKNIKNINSVKNIHCTQNIRSVLLGGALLISLSCSGPIGLFKEAMDEYCSQKDNAYCSQKDSLKYSYSRNLSERAQKERPDDALTLDAMISELYGASSVLAASKGTMQKDIIQKDIIQKDIIQKDTMQDKKRNYILHDIFLHGISYALCAGKDNVNVDLSAAVKSDAEKINDITSKYDTEKINNIISNNNITSDITTKSNNITHKSNITEIAKIDAVAAISTLSLSTQTKITHSAPETLRPTMDEIIASYAASDSGVFKDNCYYKRLREDGAFRKISQYHIKDESIVLLIDKTFQKGILVQLEEQSYVYSIDSLESLIRQNRKIKISANDPNRIVESILTPRVISEYDCSTAEIYGRKKHDGDGKTPEGIFSVYSVEESHNRLFNGLKAYGAYFLRIFNSIGIHGNGTDTTKTKRGRNDPAYMTPEPLGIYSNNFGYGLSHGCIRLDNDVVRMNVYNGKIGYGTRIIIFEDTQLTELLRKNYTVRSKDTRTNARNATNTRDALVSTR